MLKHVLVSRIVNLLTWLNVDEWTLKITCGNCIENS